MNKIIIVIIIVICGLTFFICFFIFVRCIQIIQAQFYLYHPPRSTPKTNSVWSWVKSKTMYVMGFSHQGYMHNKQDFYIDDKYIGFYINNNKDTSILYFHGTGTNVCLQYEFSYKLANELGVNVFAYEYPGYGKRRGTPSKKNILKDLKRVAPDLEHMLKDYYILGHSIGAAIAIYSNDIFLKTNGFICLNPFGNFKYFLQKFKIPRFLFWTITEKWDNYKEIKKIKKRGIIIAGENDKLIPLDQKKLLSEYNDNFECEVYEGDHSTYNNDVFLTIRNFIRK